MAAAEEQVHVIQGDVEDHYEMLEDYGSGQYARVYKAEHKETGKIVAVKLIDKADTGVNVSDDKEINVMLRIDHPYCVKLYAVYDTPTQVQLVMELLEGRDLFDRIINRKKYKEEDAKVLMRRVIEGVVHLHQRNIIHRDLKPENILLVDPEEDTQCKVADFGLSKLFPENLQQLETRTLCGTPGYVAPEVLNRLAYGVKIDVWSLGVITYIVLAGFPPFPLDMATNSVAKVKSANYTFPSQHWDGVSEAAKDFIRKMIVVDVNERLSMEQVLAHEWLA
eukprot:TRINITY_DN12746_c0_g1_i1.p1 TRINITY_DN12746_c0_g1~~TRINITY_DN12746_c0_g1_i1.p1  ORF type:complete len:279 (-),score=96.69 TRINITY_DN12746_c0_g1_i1:300-1136(-)